MTSPERTSGVFAVARDLTIRLWDDWLAHVTGIPADEARGRHLVDLFPGLAGRGLLECFDNVVEQGVVEILAPAFHGYLLPCPPQQPSPHFDHMQQRVTIAPLREGDEITGALVTVEDVTPRLDRQRGLAAQLASPDENTRLRAAEALAAEKSDEAVQHLADALGDDSWRVRRAAVGGLARHGSTEAIAALLRALHDQQGDLGMLNSVLQVLALHHADVVEPLVRFLGDGNADLRIYAAQALGEQEDLRAVPALITALDDPDSNVRYHAIEALGKLRAAAAVDALVAIVQSGDFFLAFPALEALTRIGDPQVVPHIAHLLSDELLQGPAAETLGRLGDETAVPPLVELFERSRAAASVAARALATLYDRYEQYYGEGAHIADLVAQGLSPTGIRHLLDALRQAGDDDIRPLALVLSWLDGPEVQRALVSLLGQEAVRSEIVQALVRHGRQVTSLLVEQLGQGDRETRAATAVALGRIGDPQTVAALTRLLDEDEDLAVVAANALARIGDRRAFDALLSKLGHPSPAVRQAVVGAINSLGHPDMPERATALLVDPDPRVRESAVRIAGYFGFASCIDLLLQRCDDEDERVRRAAVEHLPYLEDARVLPTLLDCLQSQAPRVRAAAAQALAQVEENVLPYLLQALRDDNLWVRYHAARSIGRHGYSEALDALAGLVKADDEAPPVRMAAMEALGRLGGARAVAVLAPIAEEDDEDLARAALAALGRIGHPDALPPLLAALRDASRSSLRIEALNALGQRGGPGVASALQWVAAADEEPAVAQAAVEALRRLATQEAVAALVALCADARRREACVAALASLKAVHQIAWIAAGLENPHPAVRRATAEALARIKRPAATERLAAALVDPDPSVRVAAVTALARMGSQVAARRVAALAQTDPDPGVRQAAQAVLRQQG